MNNINKDISPHENEIIGEWIFIDDEVEGDLNCQRIEYLINNELTEIATHENGWFRLFIDKRNNRYWEMQYLQSELHGGGPKSLIALNKTEVLRKYPNLGEL